MITIGKETLQTVIDNFNLVKEHWNEVVKDDRELDPDWDAFRKVESVGKLVVYVVREESEVLGYAVFVLYPHLHAKSMMTAHNDAVFVRKGARSRGAGIKLLRHCNEDLPRLGAKAIYWHVKPWVDFGPALVKMGYSLGETVYARYVKEN